MYRSNSTAVMAMLSVVLIILGGLALLKGGFYIAKHEGDTLHLVDIIMRMADGQVPHQDFMTPIGGLAFVPIVFFINQGLGIGISILAGQVLVAIVLFPAIWWVVTSRLSSRLAILFGGAVLVLVLALVHGEGQSSLSISMHYNRWAWALSFLAILTAIIPPEFRKNAFVDGILIGAMMSGLVMIKVTYFVAFLVPVIIGLILTGQKRTFIIAAVTGGTIAAGLTLWLGVVYWQAYFSDLITVLNSEGRSAPGLSFGSVISAPSYVGGSIVVLLGVIVLRGIQQREAGALLLMIIPGFFYVTYQNFGNDPQWLVLVGVLLLRLRPARGAVQIFGSDGRQTLNILASVALAFTTPSFVNMAMSPFRHYSIDTSNYTRILPDNKTYADLYGASIRLKKTTASVPLETFDPMFSNEPNPEDDPILWMGETLPECSVDVGMSTYFQKLTADLIENGVQTGSRIFAADIFNVHWIYADFEPLISGAPWYYGGLPGYASANYLIIPLCALSLDVRAELIDALNEHGTDGLTEITRSNSYILYKKLSD